MSEPVVVRADETHVFPRELHRRYPLIERAEGVWLYDRDGNAFLDGVGGGAMVASIRHGVPEIVEAARRFLARSACRSAIERHRPMLRLHGHLHESRGTYKFGPTVSINPGSEYNEGVLRGALGEIKKGKLKTHQFTAG